MPSMADVYWDRVRAWSQAQPSALQLMGHLVETGQTENVPLTWHPDWPGVYLFCRFWWRATVDPRGKPWKRRGR